MNFKCPFCIRTFSQRTAYSQHTQKCLKKAEIEDDVEMDIEDDKDSNYEDDNIEVNMLFLIMLLNLYQLYQLYTVILDE